MEEEITSFTAVFSAYYNGHSGFDFILLWWNFIFSGLIVALAFWRFGDIEKQRKNFHSKWEFFCVKASLILIMCGALFHAIRIETPSLHEAAFFSGVFLYLLMRRIKQRRDRKNK